MKNRAGRLELLKSLESLRQYTLGRNFGAGDHAKIFDFMEVLKMTSQREPSAENLSGIFIEKDGYTLRPLERDPSVFRVAHARSIEHILDGLFTLLKEAAPNSPQAEFTRSELIALQASHQKICTSKRLIRCLVKFIPPNLETPEEIFFDNVVADFVALWLAGFHHPQFMKLHFVDAQKNSLHLSATPLCQQLLSELTPKLSTHHQDTLNVLLCQEHARLRQSALYAAEVLEDVQQCDRFLAELSSADEISKHIPSTATAKAPIKRAIQTLRDIRDGKVSPVTNLAMLGSRVEPIQALARPRPEDSSICPKETSPRPARMLSVANKSISGRSLTNVGMVKRPGPEAAPGRPAMGHQLTFSTLLTDNDSSDLPQKKTKSKKSLFKTLSHFVPGYSAPDPSSSSSSSSSPPTASIAPYSSSAHLPGHLSQVALLRGMLPVMMPRAFSGSSSRAHPDGLFKDAERLAKHLCWLERHIFCRIPILVFLDEGIVADPMKDNRMEPYLKWHQATIRLLMSELMQLPSKNRREALIRILEGAKFCLRELNWAGCFTLLSVLGASGGDTILMPYMKLALHKAITSSITWTPPNGGKPRACTIETAFAEMQASCFGSYAHDIDFYVPAHTTACPAAAQRHCVVPSLELTFNQIFKCTEQASAVKDTAWINFQKYSELGRVFSQMRRIKLLPNYSDGYYDAQLHGILIEPEKHALEEKMLIQLCRNEVAKSKATKK